MSRRDININLREDQYFEIGRYIHLSDNFVIKGGRGLGKTYSVMGEAWKDVFKDHRPIVYCRLQDTEFKGVIGTLQEHYSAKECLVNANIDFDESYEPSYYRGRPAKTITVKYRSNSGQLRWFIVCLLCDVYQAATYKGYAAEKGKEPRWFILDEFTNGINMFTGDVELKTLDLIESFFRNRECKVLLLTNNNNENNAFTDVFEDCVFIRITKRRKTKTGNKVFNDYIEGKDIEYDMKSLRLVDYYYLTSKDIVGIYKHTKLGILIMKQENFEDKKSKAKKDKAVFNIDCQFLDDWSKNVFRLAKNDWIRLYS